MAKNASIRAPRRCALCQAHIDPKTRRVRWCSAEHAAIGRRLLARGFHVETCGKRGCTRPVLAEPGVRFRHACSDSHLDWLIAEAERAAANREVRDAQAGETATWTTAERHTVWAMTDGACAWCDSPLVIRADGFSGRDVPASATFTVDHLVPLDRGGDHAPANWLPACRSCNSARRNLLIGEWIERDQAAGREPRAQLVLADLASGTGAWARDPETSEIRLVDRAALLRG
ncbi:hypothetical protein GCM10022286_00540 [Gryllotalpicola daejeonensis]|uniref:HNH nuclease domain-containing protein n=1 Tax=Gryllotalpicola daejeonensis TaxID=993087 RepID=A0ABP7ZDS0_9MICO